MGQSLVATIVELKAKQKPAVTIETDAELLKLMERAQTEVFDTPEEFEQAFCEALAEQMLELLEVNDGVFPANLAEELSDAMHGVLLQWLGEYKCYSDQDIPRVLQRILGIDAPRFLTSASV